MLRGSLFSGHLRTLRHGLCLPGVRAAPCAISCRFQSGSKTNSNQDLPPETAVLLEKMMADKLDKLEKMIMYQPSRHLDGDLSEGENVWNWLTHRLKEFEPMTLAMGFPNWSAPSFVKQALIDAVNQDFNQYSPNTGYLPLIEELVPIYEERYGDGFHLKANNFQITLGALNGIDAVMQALLNEGDHVITIEPCFEPYKKEVAHAGGKLVMAPLDILKDGKDEKWSFNPRSLLPLLNEKTRILLLNTPHNPSGWVMSQEEMHQTLAILRDFPRVIVVADEVYEHITFGNTKHHYFAAQSDEAFERTISIKSAAKTFSVTGWRIGWCIGPPQLVKLVNLVEYGNCFSQNTPVQRAMLTILRQAQQPYHDFPSYYSWIRNEYERKCARIADITRNAGMIPVIPDSGVFVCADVKHYIEKLFPNYKREFDATDPNTYPDYRFTEFLIAHPDINVATVPLSAFHGPVSRGNIDSKAFNCIRFSACADDDTIDELEKRMRNLPQILGMH